MPLIKLLWTILRMLLFYPLLALLFTCFYAMSKLVFSFLFELTLTSLHLGVGRRMTTFSIRKVHIHIHLLPWFVWFSDWGTTTTSSKSSSLVPSDSSTVIHGALGKIAVILLCVMSMPLGSFVVYTGCLSVLSSPVFRMQVKELRSGGLAALNGMKTGDVIMKIDSTEIFDGYQGIKKLRGTLGKRITLLVRRPVSPLNPFGPGNMHNISLVLRRKNEAELLGIKWGSIWEPEILFRYSVGDALTEAKHMFAISLRTKLRPNVVFSEDARSTNSYPTARCVVCIGPGWEVGIIHLTDLSVFAFMIIFIPIPGFPLWKIGAQLLILARLAKQPKVSK